MTVKHLYQNIYLLILTVLITNTAWANLMIAPQRVVFEDRQRSASVTLINTSNQTTTYRLHWKQKKQKPNGKYINLPNDSNEVPNASSMLRFSPRQVTLTPGEKQTVRIALRRKKGLPIGEHRSHLLFQALPKADNTALNPKGAQIRIKLLLGFSIPVIVRQGKPNAAASISKLETKKSTENNKDIFGALISLTRKGPHTAYGTLQIFWKTLKFGQYKQIAILNNISLYPESSTVQYYLGLKNFKPKTGYIKITYTGRKEFEGKKFDVLERKITPREFIFEKRD